MSDLQPTERPWSWECFRKSSDVSQTNVVQSSWISNWWMGMMFTVIPFFIIWKIIILLLWFLTVDLVAMTLATESFDAHNLRGRNDNVIDVIDMIRCLKTMYERIEAKHQKLVNISLCVDLVLNWILNVYDM